MVHGIHRLLSPECNVLPFVYFWASESWFVVKCNVGYWKIIWKETFCGIIHVHHKCILWLGLKVGLPPEDVDRVSCCTLAKSARPEPCWLLSMAFSVYICKYVYVCMSIPRNISWVHSKYRSGMTNWFLSLIWIVDARKKQVCVWLSGPQDSWFLSQDLRTLESWVRT